MADGKRPGIAVWIIVLVIGAAGFYRVTHSPNFATYRAVDIVQLLASGMCAGAAMVGVIFTLRAARP